MPASGMPSCRCLSAQLYHGPEPEELVLGAVGSTHPRLRAEAWSHVAVTQPGDRLCWCSGLGRQLCGLWNW